MVVAAAVGSAAMAVEDTVVVVAAETEEVDGITETIDVAVLTSPVGRLENMGLQPGRSFDALWRIYLLELAGRILRFHDVDGDDVYSTYLPYLPIEMMCSIVCISPCD